VAALAAGAADLTDAVTEVFGPPSEPEASVEVEIIAEHIAQTPAAPAQDQVSASPAEDAGAISS